MNIGIDIGGSHIAFGLVDECGNIVEKVERNINEKALDKKKGFIEESIFEVLNNWIYVENKSVSSVGVAVPGEITNGIIEKSVNLRLNNYNLKGIIEKIFPGVRVCVENDAACSAIAEKKYGLLKNCNNALFVCFGTGIGGAIISAKELGTSKKRLNCEIGHMIIKKDGSECRCGKRGCFEQYGSMKYFKNLIKSRVELAKDLEGKELFEFVKSHKEEPALVEIIDEYTENLAIGLSNVINLIDLDMICIGGSFTYYEELLLEPLIEKINKKNYVFNKKSVPKIVCSKMKNDSGIIGSSLISGK